MYVKLYVTNIIVFSRVDYFRNVITINANLSRYKSFHSLVMNNSS